MSAVIDGESECDDCDDVIAYAQDEVNQEESEQNEVDRWRSEEGSSLGGDALDQSKQWVTYSDAYHDPPD